MKKKLHLMKEVTFLGSISIWILLNYLKEHSIFKLSKEKMWMPFSNPIKIFLLMCLTRYEPAKCKMCFCLFELTIVSLRKMINLIFIFSGITCLKFDTSSVITKLLGTFSTGCLEQSPFRAGFYDYIQKEEKGGGRVDDKRGEGKETR